MRKVIKIIIILLFKLHLHGKVEIICIYFFFTNWQANIFTKYILGTNTIILGTNTILLLFYFIFSVDPVQHSAIALSVSLEVSSQYLYNNIIMVWIY